MLANLAKEQGPTRLYVGSLHCNITETMLRAIFEPFGYVSTYTNLDPAKFSQNRIAEYVGNFYVDTYKCEM